MKNSGTCPKCSSKKIKQNTLGGFQNYMLGDIYRCGDCGFSEIWSSASHRNQQNLIIGLTVSVALLGVGFIVYMVYFN